MARNTELVPRGFVHADVEAISDIVSPEGTEGQGRLQYFVKADTEARSRDLRGRSSGFLTC